MLRYEQQLGKDTFRLGKITAVHPDVHGIVRTVTISLRNLRRTKGNNPPTTMTVGIQRLVVLLPIEETWNQGLLSEDGSPLPNQ